MKSSRNHRFIKMAHPLLLSWQQRGAAVPPPKKDQRMPNANTNLLLRNDTVLGVCEAIGQDFGFHPNWLRLTLASLFYFFPLGVIGSYLGLGVAVAFTRWIAPDKAEAVAPKAVALQSAEASDSEPVALAA
jgi:phage shock protein PspC (stress-responsive transcriptional regulator)